MWAKTVSHFKGVKLYCVESKLKVITEEDIPEKGYYYIKSSCLAGNVCIRNL
jgi:hypothetical protein